MTGALPMAIRRPVTRTWPPLARLAGGAVLGAGIAHYVVSTDGPTWRIAAAAAVLGVVALGAPATARAATLGGAPAWALATAVGLYAGVPETDHVIGVGVGLAAFVVAELTGRARANGAAVVALGAALVWATLQGAGASQPALLAGFGAFGLLAVWPVVGALPGPRRSLAPAPLRPALVGAAHAVGAVVIGRRGAVVAERVDVTLFAAVGLAALLVVVRLVTGGGRRARA